MVDQSSPRLRPELTPAHPDRARTSGRAAVGALLGANALLRVGAVGAGVAVQLDVTDLGGGHPAAIGVGLIGATQALSEMACSPFLARFADRCGRSRFLVGGPLLGGIGTLLVAAAAAPGQIGALRILEGVGAAAFTPTALGTIAAATRADRSARAGASGAFEGSTLLGYAGGFIVGPFAYQALHRGAFLLLAALYGLAALVCARFVPRVPPLPVSSLRVVWRAIARRGPIRVFVPAWIAVNALIGAWSFNVASLLRRQADPHQTLVHGFDARVIGLIMLAWVLLLLVGIGLWTPILARIGGPATMRRAVPGVFVVTAGLLAINHLPGRWAPVFLPLVAAGVLIQAGFGPAAVAYLADCSEQLVADRSALMAFYTVTLAAGGALGAILGGIAARIALADGLIGLGALLGLVALVALRQVVRQARGDQARHATAGPELALRGSRLSPPSAA
ncbi:MAG: MFS transporter [Candidatus Dormibacteria bacterium]